MLGLTGMADMFRYHVGTVAAAGGDQASAVVVMTEAAVIRDLAVILGDRGECLFDLGALRDQSPLFGQVASESTAFRVIDPDPPSSRRRHRWRRLSLAVSSDAPKAARDTPGSPALGRAVTR